jgi:hypothetical protein
MSHRNDIDSEGLAWQTGIWDKMSDVYLEEVDQRFVPVIDGVIIGGSIDSDRLGPILTLRAAALS